MITLITAPPGAGKSLLAITKGLAFVAEGRPVYAEGFKDLDYAATGFAHLPSDFTSYDPANKDDKDRVMPDWQLLPHGSVIILDECYDYIPTRSPGTKVPPHIDALARHRHHGYDIILVTQQHKQIDSFVQGLIGEHIHVRRKFGFNTAVLKTWDRFKSNTEAMDCTTKPIWKYPKKNFGLYTSATQHTVKKSLPWYVWSVPILLAVVFGGAWYASHGFKKMGTQTTGAKATGGGVPISGTSGQRVKDADDDLRQRDYTKWIAPRVSGQPWTAPAWDQLQVQGVPAIYCIAAADGDCKCITEQGTHYEIQPNMCRTIAREGTYNPFRSGLNQRRDDAGRDRDDQRERSGGPSTMVASNGSGRAGLQRGRTIPQAYVPPEYQPSHAED